MKAKVIKINDTIATRIKEGTPKSLPTSLIHVVIVFKTVKGKLNISRAVNNVKPPTTSSFVPVSPFWVTEPAKILVSSMRFEIFVNVALYGPSGWTPYELNNADWNVSIPVMPRPTSTSMIK